MELSRAAEDEDAAVRAVTGDMCEKFDKYWRDCSLMLSIAVVMDPHFKMKLIEFSYLKLIEAVKDALCEMYQDYALQPETDDVKNDVEDGAGDGLMDFDQYVSETARNQNRKLELEQYLEEGVSPRLPEFDVLNWWKLNTVMYPVLSRMARDVLAIPMTVALWGGGRFLV